jgi:hypothetical protein
MVRIEVPEDVDLTAARASSRTEAMTPSTNPLFDAGTIKESWTGRHGTEALRQAFMTLPAMPLSMAMSRTPASDPNRWLTWGFASLMASRMRAVCR